MCSSDLVLYGVHIDRREAIKNALGMARAGDAVLLAGKGHETYQVIGKESLPFDDRAVAREVLNEIKSAGNQ